MDKKRRSFKKIVGAGMITSVLPSAWVKPIVDIVFIPTHAQTTETTTDDPSINRYFLREDTNGGAPSVTRVTVDSRTGIAILERNFGGDNPNFGDTGTKIELNIDGTSSTNWLPVSGSCDILPDAVASITNYIAGSDTIIIQINNLNPILVPKGNGVIPSPSC